MLCDVETGNNMMLTRLTPVATFTDTKQQSATTSISTEIVTFSWHLCNRRDVRVESQTHAKRTITRKKLSAKSNIFSLNKTENTDRCCDRKSRAACAQSFAPRQQATIEIMRRNLSYYCLLAPRIYIFVLRAHPVRGESHNQDKTTGEVATIGYSVAITESDRQPNL